MPFHGTVYGDKSNLEKISGGFPGICLGYVEQKDLGAPLLLLIGAAGHIASAYIVPTQSWVGHLRQFRRALGRQNY